MSGQRGEDGLRQSCVVEYHMPRRLTSRPDAAPARRRVTFATRASLGLSTPFSLGGGAAPAHLHSGAVEVMQAIYWQRAGEGGGRSALFFRGYRWVLWSNTVQGSCANPSKRRLYYSVVLCFKSVVSVYNLIYSV